MRRIRSKKSLISFGLLASIIFLSLTSTMVSAATQIMYETPAYSSSQAGGSSPSRTEVEVNPTTGYHRAKCWNNAWAFAMVGDTEYHTDGQLTKINMQVTFEDTSVSGPWYGCYEAKIWVQFIDTTDSEVLLDDKSRNYGPVWQNYYFEATVENNHNYRAWVGVWVRSWVAWPFYGKVEAEGTSLSIYVFGDP